MKLQIWHHQRRVVVIRYQRKDTIDPIALDEIDEINEWLIGKMDGDDPNEDDDLVFEGDDLTWSVVSRATGANEPTYATRGASKTKASSSKVDKGKGVASKRFLDEDEDEEGFGVDMEMEEDIGEDIVGDGDGDDEFFNDDY